MKRLVDETTDELARSLLQAGIEHRPPSGNKAQVIVALGAGGALGMFSSNAFAWLGTTAGKVTAVGVAVGVASAVWVAVPPSRDARSEADASGAASGAKVAAQLPAPLDELANNRVPNGPAAGASPAAHSPAEHPSAGNEPGAAASAESALAAADTSARDADTTDFDHATDARGSAASGERQGRSSRRERASKFGSRTGAGKEKVVASKPSELRRDGPLPAAETPLAGGAHDEPSAEQADLDREVRLVDNMHSAARRNDREALGRFLEHYRATFPDGQLKREVAEFAARLERPDTSITR